MLQLTHMMNEAIGTATGSDLHANADVITLVTLYLDGPQRPRDLTTLTGFTRGGTTNLIDRLVANGVVTRTEVASDRRGVSIELTDHGLKTAERLAATSHRVLNFAAPLIEGWKEHFIACGCELGRRWVPRSDRQSLVQTLELGRAGQTLQPVYDAAFGTDHPRRSLVLHVLLLATEAGGTRPTWISDATYLSSASTSDLLDRLEEQGFVARITGVEPDRRVTVVTATQQGRDALDYVIENTDPTMRAFAQVLYPRVAVS